MPQTSHSRINSTFSHDEQKEMSSLREMFVIQSNGSLYLTFQAVGGVTEEELVVAPSEYWEETLKADVEDILQTKRKRHQSVRSKDTAVTMKANDRS